MPLVSSQDGARTFGWGDGHARFGRRAPTLTSPPYTELEFPLHLRTRGATREDMIQAVVRSLRQPATRLNTVFFSRANVDVLHMNIRARILERLQVRIDRQSDWDLLAVMRRVYLETASNWPDDVHGEVLRLNDLVVQVCVDIISRNVTRYMTYRSRVPMPDALPGPAEMLTTTPYPTGTPAPLRNLNDPFPRVSTRPKVVIWPTTPPREHL